MMTEIEAGLLQRFLRARDAEAFAHITRRHAGMVYGTCLRITGNREAAADAAQETFFEFLKNASRVTGSVGGWLHQVATRRAIDLVRRDSSRRQREQAYAAQASVETDHWADVSPLVDEAISELDRPLREILVCHFLVPMKVAAPVLPQSGNPPVTQRIASRVDSQGSTRSQVPSVAVGENWRIAGF